MNILYISSSANLHIDLWTKYFIQKHSVYLFSVKGDNLREQPFRNVKIIKSDGYLGKALRWARLNSRFLFHVNKFISARRFGDQIDKVVQKHNIDIVHAHSLYSGYLVSFIKSNVPVVFTPLGSDVIIHSQRNRIYRHMAKNAFSRADIITGDSLLLQSQGHKVGAREENNYIIQNGADSNVMFPKSNDVKSRYGVLDNEVLVFSPRAIEPLYNINVIIESLNRLTKLGYEIKCMFSFAFGNEYIAALKDLVTKFGIDERVIWLGFLTYEEMAQHYNAADIIVSVPSSDSSPKSVYEAMFCGKPIVISDLEWSHELLSDYDCVSRVEPGNAVQLSGAISKIIDDKDYAANISSNAMICARRHFDYEVNMKKMEKIMHGIVT